MKNLKQLILNFGIEKNFKDNDLVIIGKLKK